MNFFDHQAVRKRQSALLLVCFVAALVAIGVVINTVVAGLSFLLGESESLFDLAPQAAAMIGLVWLTIALGAIFRAMDVSAGGAMLARRFGAIHVSDRSRDEKEQQLLNIVAEISIASSTPQPEVYILRKESSINAFVLGRAPAKTTRGKHAIVVTQGALERFDRDELQAVVAHEFGHIANGDLPLNMNLLIVMGGLMAIDEVGRVLVGKTGGDSFHPGILVGYLLVGLGSLGVFFGQLVRSAFSRQREYLADASAVQFTRNPYAMASALHVVTTHNHEPALHNIHANELAHLCFQSGKTKSWLRSLLSSHPHLQRRIDAIDPNFSLKHRKAQKARKTKAERSASAGGQIPGVGMAVPLGHQQLAALSDGAFILLSDVRNSVAALFAIFASKDVNQRREYLNAISFAFDAKFAARVKEFLKIIPDELDTKKLSIIEHATGVVSKSLSREERRQLLMKLEDLLSASSDYDLMGYASLQLIRGKMDVKFPVLRSVVGSETAKMRHVKRFDSMGDEFALLLSLMVESSGASQAVQEQEFERVLRCYTSAKYPRRSGNETGIVQEVAEAFQTLYVQPRPIREAFVQHCIEIVNQDGIVVGEERALLELFAASLGCQQKAA